ncbi:MAG: DEAD/DEAH box helicase [Flavobacteriia bacterium]|nr:DEAD/DEAH box helicase [Flavobacteriia bacterium]
MTFHDLSLIQPLLTAIERVGYTQPTPIQAKAIPSILKGQDLMGCAQTGTGKTAAFAIPILQLLTIKPRPEGKRKIRTLILTPTRELAIQIEENIQAYGKDLDHRHAVIFGGVNQHSQVIQIKNGIDILVATPGRLLDLHQQGIISLQHLEIFVLDEADRMLDMGFIHDVNRIIKLIPSRRQTLFFSATMPKEIKALANTLLTNPEMVVVTPISSTAETVEQSIVFVETAEKKDVLLHLLHENATPSVLVFTRTKHGADRVVKMLAKAKITAAAIHGNKSQNARQNALNGFKQQKIRVLVATDIAARGIDIDDLNLVVNYDLPNVPETYVHRIGRTGRAGANGQAISFCNQEERAYLKDIQKLIGKTLAENPSYSLN